MKHTKIRGSNKKCEQKKEEGGGGVKKIVFAKYLKKKTEMMQNSEWESEIRC